MRGDQTFYEMTRSEQQTDWMKKLNHAYFNLDRKFYFGSGSNPAFGWNWVHRGFPMISLHVTMF